MASKLKTADRRAKRNLGPAVVVTCISGTFDLLIFNVIFFLGGGVRYTCLKIFCISKTAGRRTKWCKIWDSWFVVMPVCIRSTFDHLLFKFWSFGVRVLTWPVTREWLAVELQEMKFGIWRLVLVSYT